MKWIGCITVKKPNGTDSRFQTVTPLLTPIPKYILGASFEPLDGLIGARS
jgi:hypothetical protein